MGDATLHLIKLCVGADGPDDLRDFQRSKRALTSDGLPRHVTRMWPKRAPELLNGGALYWVFRGKIRARQTILRLDEVIDAEGVRRCGIVLDPSIILTRAILKRPFQGWRYLLSADAPADLAPLRDDGETLPEDISRELDHLGVI